MIKLALIFGGKSAEREVSISGVKGVENALDKEKYKIKKYDAATDLPKLIEDAPNLDCAFILLHGKYGEDGTIQGLLDLIGLPYQSSGVLGSAIAMDKHLSKVLYKEAGLKTPSWVFMDAFDRDKCDTVKKDMRFPVVVKPCKQGSSVGIELVNSPELLENALKEAFRWDDQVIVEEYIKGREMTGGVLGLDELTALPIVEIIPGDEFEFFDYRAKYEPGATKEVCPAEIDDDLSQRLKEIAIKAHKALKLSIYSRTDMIVSETGDIFVIETNTIPGMTPTSLFPQAAAAFGIGFSELLDTLIELAIKRGSV